MGFWIGAVLCIAQVGKGADAHETLLQGFNAVEAGQQGGCALQQTPLVRAYSVTRRINGGKLGLPVGVGYKQVIQVPCLIDWDFSAGKAGVHTGSQQAKG